MPSRPLSSSLREQGYRLLRSIFRSLPLRDASRDAMRNWFTDRFSSWIPRSQTEAANAHTLHRRLRSAADERAIGAVPRRYRPLPAALPAKLVAFYLPQFHRIDENDAWWGEGFTEWRNVARALPQFEGHFQPRLPDALGFYDLADRRTLHRQAELAREYGVSAFCFYYYWFNGQRLLESPLEHWLEDQSLDLAACLCWANEPWTRQWDGRPQDILIAQHHDPEDDLAFIAHVARYLRNPRYLKIDGRPLILIYRPGLLPSAADTIDRWRRWCRTNGIGEIFIAYVQSFERPDPADIGCDAAVEFPPNLIPAQSLTENQVALNPEFCGEIIDWRDMERYCRTRSSSDYLLFPGVNPSWDNQPRRPGAGRTLLHSSPRRYQSWLEATISERLPHIPPSQRLIFINAWNEWAEGAILEPDQRWDHAWLDATREALRSTTNIGVESLELPLTAVIHAWHPGLLQELIESLDPTWQWRLLITTGHKQQREIEAIAGASRHAYEVQVHENRGRDILPFLRAADRLRDEGCPFFLKLHTKRSEHRTFGHRWRHHLVKELLPPSGVTGIVQRFQDDSSLGLLAPAGHLLELHQYMSANSNAIDYACRRIGIPRIHLADALFVAGSMFWVRTEALGPILDAGWAPGEFEPENGQLDGTLMHALERLVLVSVREAGFHTDVVDGRHAQPLREFYPR